MNPSRKTLAGTILALALVATIFTLVIMPQLSYQTAILIFVAVAAVLGAVGFVADIIGLFGENEPTPAGRQGGVDIAADEVDIEGDAVGRDKHVHGDEVRGDKQTVTQTDTGGGAHVGGSIDTGGGDFISRDQVIHGDQVRIDRAQIFSEPEKPRSLHAPPPPDTFAGRTQQLDELAQKLAQGEDVAISAAVQGMGGIGKTTLAQRLGRDLQEQFPAGVLWIDVGWQARLSDVVDSVALDLGLDLKDEPRPERRAATVQATLAQRGRLLVVLDDVWEVDVGRRLLQEVVPPDRAVLITSRDLALCRALGSFVERLDVLPQEEAVELVANILGELGEYEPAAREVVDLVEGLPLALDLGARLCDNGPADLPWLAERLKQKPSLDILKLEGRETRQASVEACLALSYAGLDDDLQRRFRALGAFAAAPFDLPALAAVWGDEDLETAEDAARALQRRGLLVRAEDRLPAEAEAVGQPVFRQHSLLRAYVLTLLRQAEEPAEPMEAHAAYYQWLAGESWPAGELFWEQVVHGWGWAWEAGPERALDFYHGVKEFLSLRGRHEAHIGWVSALLALPAEAVAEKERGALLNNLARVYDALGEKQKALDFYNQALPIWHQVSDRAGEATTLNNIGRVYTALGEKQQALDYYNQALPIRRQVGDRAGEAATLNNIGYIYWQRGEPKRTVEMLQQAIQITREVGAVAGEAARLFNLAVVLHSSLERTGEAAELVARSVEILKRYELPCCASGYSLA
ncbi:MAG: Regulatory protein AfsR [Anaerolineales bacterium]|nr:Regulatory protein AfsR [Anaerolineales bacterium]